MSNSKEIPKKRRSRSKEDKAKQMEKILESSFNLISSKGFEGLGMQVLAKHLGMSKGNLYNYISSKRELWLAVRIKTMKDFKNQLENIVVSSEGSSIDILKKIGNFVFDFAAEDFNRWKLITSTRPPEPPLKNGKPFIGDIEKNYKSSRVLDIIFKILQDGYRKGQVQDLDLKLIGFYLYSLVLGVTYLEYDILTDDIVRDSEIHDNLKFERQELRDLALLQMDKLLRKPE